MSSNPESYNGWANVETWRVQLHIANDTDEGGYIATVAMLYATKYATTPPGPDDFLPPTLSEYLRDYVEARSGVGEVGGHTFEMFARDVVEAALLRVDWEQIAAHWLDAARHEIAKGAAT
jgi:hypothetical protein